MTRIYLLIDEHSELINSTIYVIDYKGDVIVFNLNIFLRFVMKL